LKILPHKLEERVHMVDDTSWMIHWMIYGGCRLLAILPWWDGCKILVFSQKKKNVQESNKKLKFYFSTKYEFVMNF